MKTFIGLCLVMILSLQVYIMLKPKPDTNSLAWAYYTGCVDRGFGKAIDVHLAEFVMFDCLTETRKQLEKVSK